MTFNNPSLGDVRAILRRRVLPDPADFGKIPGFQCRPVSITSRNMKAAMHGANGFPNAALLFKCPRWICTPGIPQPEF